MVDITGKKHSELRVDSIRLVHMISYRSRNGLLTQFSSTVTDSGSRWSAHASYIIAGIKVLAMCSPNQVLSRT